VSGFYLCLYKYRLFVGACSGSVYFLLLFCCIVGGAEHGGAAGKVERIVLLVQKSIEHLCKLERNVFG
jgi:hypothetical protein